METQTLLRNLTISIDKKIGIKIQADVVIKRDEQFYTVPLNMIYSVGGRNPLTPEMINSVIQQALYAAEQTTKKWIIYPEDSDVARHRDSKAIREQKIEL